MKRYLKPETIAGNLIIPTALLLGYSGLFIALNHFLSPYLSTDNVNYYFVRALITLAIPVLLVSLLALGWLVIRRGRAPHSVPESGHRKGEVPASLLIALLPLAPVIRYLFSNQDILSLFDVIVLLVGCLGVSIALVVAIPALLRKYSSFRLLASTAGAFVFTIVNMAAISGLFRWLEIGNPAIQVSVFVGTLAIIWLLLGLKHKRELGFLVIVFLVGSAALQLPTQSETPSTEEAPNASYNNRLTELVAGRPPARSPNIYLLVYDAYVPNETLANYGIDNSAQEAFLVEQGFTLYPHTYSVGADTLISMNRVFNVSLDHYGHSRNGVSGNGVAHKLLQSLGYQVMGIFPYDRMFADIEPQYDYYVPHSTIPSYQLISWAIWMGEFRYDIGLDTISHEEYVQAKREVFTSPSEGSVFVYTHSSLPSHSQNSGVCLPDETEHYARRLSKANEEMRQDITAIIANEPNAIVIVAGDHGPYLTKNCTGLGGYDPAEITRTDIQDRNGAFLAVRWPSEDHSEYDQITVLQDIFPAVFAWMYRDPSLLDAKIEPNALRNWYNGGVGVNDGVIVGGADDGQPLYLSSE